MNKQASFLLAVSCILIGLFFGSFLQREWENSPITIAVIKEAEKIIGLKFTKAEADSMQENLTDQRANYEKIRRIEIPNEITPALVFNPLPAGFDLPKGKEMPFKVEEIREVKLPNDQDELAFFTVRQLAELIKTKQITSLELTNFYLNRLKEYNPTLQCLVSLTEVYAIEQAKKADKEIAEGKYRGLLHGIPYGAKDLLAKEGYKTTWGAFPYKDQRIEKDATVIKKLEEAGAVLVAKLTLGALAWGDVWYGGKTKNPWNPEQGSSGSSAGSASAVSAGLVPFAIGTETLGSIVSPSTVCGVTGLRPTFGRVSRTGAMALSWSMDKIGPIARTVEDCAIVFNSIYGPDGKDLSVIDAPFNYDGNKDIKSIRVAYFKNAFESDYSFQAFDEAALEKLRNMGVEMVPVELPNLPISEITFILDAEAAAAFDELTRNNKDDLLVRQIKKAWPNVFRQARFIPAVEYIQANRIRSLLIAEMAEKMKDIDVYIAPTFEGNNLTLTNLTGHPCVVLPNGFNEEGLPVSITFTGKLFGEADLLALAKAYQEATNFHLKHPELGE